MEQKLNLHKNLSKWEIIHPKMKKTDKLKSQFYISITAKEVLST